MKFARPTTGVRVLTAAAALPLLLQLLGLNVLCFCGACPASAILWPAEVPDAADAHACCHHADAPPEVDADAPQLAGQSCCGDDHVWRPATVLAPDLHAPQPTVVAVAVASLPAVSATTPLISLQHAQWTLARGPPAVPIYLRHLSLQI